MVDKRRKLGDAQDSNCKRKQDGFAEDTLITRRVRASRKLVIAPVYPAHTRVIPDQRVLFTADCISAEYIHANKILFPVPSNRGVSS